MPSLTLRGHWNAMSTWSAARAKRETTALADRQPVVFTFVMAYLDDEGPDATGLALHLVLALDALHESLLDRAPARVKERVMERALDEAERGFAELAAMEPALALRRMLHRRDEAAPEIVAEIIERTMEEAESDPTLAPHVGAVFVAAKAVLLAYRRANDLPLPATSLGDAIEARRGRRPRAVGRNDPCPCGSGRKFKKCCATADVPAPPATAASTGEARFFEYMELVRGALIYYQ